MSDIVHKYQVASGPSFNDCHWLGYRYPGPDLRWEEAESWVCRTRDGIGSSATLPGFVTDLSRGDQYVWAVNGSHILRQPVDLPPREDWEETPTTDLSPDGIWALHDESVFAWGGSTRLGPTMAHFDGREWRAVSVPTSVLSVHGTRDGAVYAVGFKGYIARWDGHAFQAVESPVATNLCDVFVASDDSLYACGLGGELLRGTQYGWELVLRHSSPLYCVAEWDDRVWVGGGEAGILSLQGESLQVEKDKIFAERFDARGTLLVTAPTFYGQPVNHPAWTGVRIDGFERITASVEPGW